MTGHHNPFRENGDLPPWRSSAPKKAAIFLMGALMTREIMCSRDAQFNTGE